MKLFITGLVVCLGLLARAAGGPIEVGAKIMQDEKGNLLMSSRWNNMGSGKISYQIQIAKVDKKLHRRGFFFSTAESYVMQKPVVDKNCIYRVYGWLSDLQNGTSQGELTIQFLDQSCQSTFDAIVSFESPLQLLYSGVDSYDGATKYADFVKLSVEK